MVAFILTTDFDLIAYMSKMAHFFEAFFTPMAFLEYDPQFLEIMFTPQHQNDDGDITWIKETNLRR